MTALSAATVIVVVIALNVGFQHFCSSSSLSGHDNFSVEQGRVIYERLKADAHRLMLETAYAQLRLLERLLSAAKS